MADAPEFTGAKLVCLIGGKLLTLLRDDTPDIPFPNHWDLPGGGREGAESAEACVLRETQEEFGLRLEPGMLIWRRWYHSLVAPDTRSAWFGAVLSANWADRITFGEEGQRWALMPPADWLALPRLVPQFHTRVQDGLSAMDKCLSSRGETPISPTLRTAFRQELP